MLDRADNLGSPDRPPHATANRFVRSQPHQHDGYDQQDRPCRANRSAPPRRGTDKRGRAARQFLFPADEPAAEQYRPRSQRRPEASAWYVRLQRRLQTGHRGLPLPFGPKDPPLSSGLARPKNRRRKTPPMCSQDRTRYNRRNRRARLPATKPQSATPLACSVGSAWLPQTHATQTTLLAPPRSKETAKSLISAERSSPKNRSRAAN